MLVRDRGELGHRLDRADLVVRMHHRDERGLGGDRFAQPIGCDDAGVIDREQGGAPSAARERAERIEDSLVLDGAGDEMTASGGLERVGRAANREVISLGAAAGEHDLRRIAVHERRDRASRVVHGGLRLMAEVMHARCVAEGFARRTHDGLGHFWRERGRRVVVKIDTHSESFIVPLPLTLGNKRTRQGLVAPLYWRQLRAGARRLSP